MHMTKELRVGLGGQSFFAFSNYVFDAKKVCFCCESMVGWYHNFHVFYGVRIDLEEVASVPAAPASKKAVQDEHKSISTSTATTVATVHAKVGMSQLGCTARGSSK